MTQPQQWFLEHPDKTDGVMKAAYAYHTPFSKEHPGTHDFEGEARESECMKCGRSREMVRHDDLPPTCSEHPLPLDIHGILQAEEERFERLIKAAEKAIPKETAKRGMSGETLAFLHTTLGYCPETVSMYVEVPHNLMADYQKKMEQEKGLSRKAIVRKVVTVFPKEHFTTGHKGGIIPAP